MKGQKILIVAMVCSIFSFLIGYKLTKIYGFDPPYSYQYIGLFLQLFSLVTGVTVIIILLFKIDILKFFSKYKR